MFSWEWGVVRVALELVPTSREVMFGVDISQEVVGHPGYSLPEQSHSSEMRCARQLPSHELMSIYFWAKHDAIGFAPMTLVGLKPSF